MRCFPGINTPAGVFEIFLRQIYPTRGYLKYFPVKYTPLRVFEIFLRQIYPAILKNQGIMGLFFPHIENFCENQGISWHTAQKYPPLGVWGSNFPRYTPPLLNPLFSDPPARPNSLLPDTSAASELTSPSIYPVVSKLTSFPVPPPYTNRISTPSFRASASDASFPARTRTKKW